MNATQKARRVDALNIGNENRRRLCEMIVHREADNDELRAENDRLRELVRALLTSHEKMCTQRGHCFGCTFFYEEVKACPYVKISRTLRELGVEVGA